MIDTSITDIAFDDAQMERWYSRPRARKRYTCSTCAHYGCCDGLPNCGGTYWQNAMSECPVCGKEFFDEGDWQNEDGNSFCSEGCLVEWENEHKEQEDEQ